MGIERDGNHPDERAYQIESMKNARPAKPFSSDDPIEYTFHMSMFEEATNQSTITSQDKLREMIYWFDGNPRNIIMYHRTNTQSTPDIAYKHAKAELDSLFKATRHTVCDMMNAITSGEQLEANDIQGHLNLYSNLRRIEAVANCIDSVGEVHREDFVINIFRNRLNHLAYQFIENQTEREKDEESFYNFDDLMKEIRDWMRIESYLQSMDPEGTRFDNDDE